jgi:hypothetical protein
VAEHSNQIVEPFSLVGVGRTLWPGAQPDGFLASIDQSVRISKLIGTSP